MPESGLEVLPRRVGILAGFFILVMLCACSSSISCDPNSSGYRDCERLKQDLKQMEDEASAEADRQLRDRGDQVRETILAEVRRQIDQARTAAGETLQGWLAEAADGIKGLPGSVIARDPSTDQAPGPKGSLRVCRSPAGYQYRFGIRVPR